MKKKNLFSGIIAFILGVLLWSGSTAFGAADGPVYVLTIDGPVNQAMTNYFTSGLADAERNGAQALLIELDTPGGAIDATLNIVQLIRNAPIPVIVYVTPTGAQAASAGSVITLAGHASGMAPETVMGAASPVQATGEDIAETLYRKAVEDLKAVMRNLTENKGGEAQAVAEAMVEEARAVTGEEALALGLIDAVADDRTDLLTQLDGLTVAVDGAEVVLNTADAEVITRPMTSVESILFQLASILMNPIFISALIGLGVQAIIFEFSNPGGWVAGFIGFVCIALALYGLGQLPVNFIGLALILTGFVLLLMELFTPTYGALSVTGTITLVAGFLILFNTPATPEFARLSWPAAILIGLASSGMSLFIGGKGLAIQRKQPFSGQEGLVGKVGHTRSLFNKDGSNYAGTVFVYGSLWRAEADEPLDKGDKVRVTKVDGITVTVGKEE
ncbi:MAG: nodulation protein NfeD [Ardenticatenaceae bacterium]|nr:nodulation protein NfeD [Ardenticatenaceae bacterium]